MVSKNVNPDRGPPMIEGAHVWDKGYTSDNEDFSPVKGDEMRGNEYFKMRNASLKMDAVKLKRSKFSKTA